MLNILIVIFGGMSPPLSIMIVEDENIPFRRMVVHGTQWYPRFLGLKHHLHSPYEKSMIERTMQYVKDRTECFDDYFPCRTRKCKLEHVRNWLNLFVDYHNKEIIKLK